MKCGDWRLLEFRLQHKFPDPIRVQTLWFVFSFLFFFLFFFSLVLFLVVHFLLSAVLRYLANSRHLKKFRLIPVTELAFHVSRSSSISWVSYSSSSSSAPSWLSGPTFGVNDDDKKINRDWPAWIQGDGRAGSSGIRRRDRATRGKPRL